MRTTPGGIVAMNTRIVLLAGALALAPTLAFAQQAPLGCPSDYERAVVLLVNQERVKAGLAPLKMDVRLMEAAQLHAEDMHQRDTLTHTGSDGSRPYERMIEAGYLPYWALGENAAAGYPTPERVVSAWMHSSGHRANILNPSYTHTGVGFVDDESASFWFFWVQDFGGGATTDVLPSDECPACSNATDDDGDGFADFPYDPECIDYASFREDASEWIGVCGLGAELSLVLLPLAALRRRRLARR
jgi:uncharacterized protein YkwD